MKETYTDSHTIGKKMELHNKNTGEYGLEDIVKGRVDDETLDRIAHKADELQRKSLNDEEKRIAEEDKEDAKYRKMIVK